MPQSFREKKPLNFFPNQLSLTKFANQVLKKENEKQKNLFFGVKFE